MEEPTVNKSNKKDELKKQNNKYKKKMAIKNSRADIKKFKEALVDLNIYISYYNFICNDLIDNLNYIEHNREKLKENPEDESAFLIFSEEEMIETYSQNKKHILTIQENIASTAKQALVYEDNLPSEKTQKMKERFLKTKKLEFFKRMMEVTAIMFQDENYDFNKGTYKKVDLYEESVSDKSPVFPKAFEFIETIFDYNQRPKPMTIREAKEQGF